MRRCVRLFLSLSCVFLGSALPAAADVIQLFRDSVQLAAHADYVDPLTGQLVQKDATFNGPSANVKNEALADFPYASPSQAGSASFTPQSSANGNGFNLTSWSYPGDCLFNQVCPTVQSQTAVGRVDWMFRVLGPSTWASLELDAYNSSRDQTRVALYDLTAQLFVADYSAADDPVQHGQFGLISGHSYRLFGSAAVPSAWGDPIARVGFTTNADIVAPAVPEPATLLLLGTGIAALGARRRSLGKKAAR